MKTIRKKTRTNNLSFCSINQNWMKNNNPLRSVTGAKGVVLLNALERKKKEAGSWGQLPILFEWWTTNRPFLCNEQRGRFSFCANTEMFDQCLHPDLLSSTTKSKMCGFRFFCRTSLPEQEVYKVLIKNYLRKFFVTLPSGITSHYLVIIDCIEQNITKKAAEYRLLCLTRAIHHHRHRLQWQCRFSLGRYRGSRPFHHPRLPARNRPY